MPEAAEYLDLETLVQNAEDISNEEVEEANYTPYSVTPPGRYISLSRVISGKRRDDGHFGFKVEFTGGLASEADPSKVYEKGNFPLTDRRISTKPFQDFDRGVTSGASKYLRAFGISTKGKTAAEVAPLLIDTQTAPVGVIIGREAKAEKNDETGTWERPAKALRTKNFRNEDGTLNATATDPDGRVWKGAPVVEGYFQLK